MMIVGKGGREWWTGKKCPGIFSFILLFAYFIHFHLSLVIFSPDVFLFSLYPHLFQNSLQIPGRISFFFLFSLKFIPDIYP